MDKLIWFLAGAITMVASWWSVSIMEMTYQPRQKNKYVCKTCGGRLHPGLGCSPAGAEPDPYED